MFWSVVFIKITGTLLAFGVMQQLFTTKPLGKLWYAACSNMYDWLLFISEVFPGTVNVAFPGTQICSLSTPILLCPQAHHEGYKIFGLLLYTTSLSLLVIMDLVYIESPVCISLTTADVSVIINTQLLNNSGSMFCGHWDLLNTSVEYFFINSQYANFTRFHPMMLGSLVFFYILVILLSPWQEGTQHLGLLNPRTVSTL